MQQPPQPQFHVVRDKGGRWIREYCGGCSFVDLDGETWAAVPRAADSHEDPTWFERMFDPDTGVAIYPSLRRETVLMPAGTQLPRSRTQGRLLNWMNERIQQVDGECHSGTQMRTYEIVTRSSAHKYSLTSAIDWPHSAETAGGGSRVSLVIGYDRTVAPFIHVRKEISDLVAMGSHGLTNAVHSVIESVRDAIDATLAHHEGQVGSDDVNFRPWSLRVMNSSGPDKSRHSYFISLWFVVANLVMPSVYSVRTHFASMVDQHIDNPHLRGCIDCRCYTSMTFPMPWSRDDDNNCVVPIDPDTLQPVCRPSDGPVRMALKLGDYFPTPHLRRRRLVSPTYMDDGTGDEAYWTTNNDFALVDPVLFGDDAVVESAQSAAELLAKLSEWRFRIPAYVMRLARNLVAMGVGTDELERRTPIPAYVEEAKRMRPSARDVHDGVLVRWARIDSERRSVTAPPAAQPQVDADGAIVIPDGDDGSQQPQPAAIVGRLPLEERIARPIEQTTGAQLYDLESHVVRARNIQERPPKSVVGILQRAEFPAQDASIYVRPYGPASRGIRFVKAALGTGKSVANWETVVNWLKASHTNALTQRNPRPLRVLVGTPRRTLAAAAQVSANQYLERNWDPWERAENTRLGRPQRRAPLRFVHYMDESVRRPQQQQQQQQSDGDLCVWQLESFRKLADVAPFDLVLFDEVASLLRCLTGPMVRKSRGQMEDTIKEFSRLINAAKLVIVSDGNLTIRDIRAINDACSHVNTASRQLVIYRHIPDRGRVVWFFSERPPRELLQRTPSDRKSHAVKSCTGLSKWLSAICRDVKLGRSVYVYSGSKRILIKNLMALLADIPGLDVDRDVLLLTADTIDHSAPMDVMRIWATKRVVAVSPTVTVGLDFSPPQPYFHSVYAYVSTFGAGPRDSVQSMVRVRHTIDRTVNVCMRMHLRSRAENDGEGRERGERGGAEADERDGEEQRVSSSQQQRVPKRKMCAHHAMVRSNFVRRITSCNSHVWSNEPVWLEELAVDNALEDDVSQSDVLNCVRTLLTQAGYDSSGGHVFRRLDLDDEDALVYQPSPIDRTFDGIEDITTEQYLNIKQRYATEGVSEEQKLRMLRYEYLHNTAVDAGDHDANAAIWDWTCAKRRCYHAFRRVAIEKTADTNSAVARIVERDAQHTNLVSFISSTNVQLHVILTIYRDVLRIPGSWVAREFTHQEASQWPSRIKLLKDVATRQFVSDRVNQLFTPGFDCSVRDAVKWLDRLLGSWSGATVFAFDTTRGSEVRTEVQWNAVEDSSHLVFRHCLVPGMTDIQRHIRLTT